MDAYPVRIPTRARRVVTNALAATAALALAFAGVALSPAMPGAEAASRSSSAVAGPATVATTNITATGAFSGTVPAGVCTVEATVTGGSGGSAVTTTSNANGAGAKITATYPVVPGMPYSGTVGGGGGKPTGNGSADTAGPGGTNGGGLGGTSGPVGTTKHHGAGGGGYTDLSFDGTLAILAGGGGGAGGGHSTGTDGTGGDAGRPLTDAAGIFNGVDGNDGKDYPATTVGGGVGGTSTPGAGGVNGQMSAANGYAGTLRVGGTGGDDTNPDAGGGGGGGYAGGGGGASTKTYNTEVAQATQIAGAGGGGGSSYVAPSSTYGAVSAISSTLNAKITSAMAGNGANGALSLAWQGCDYDLSVDKTVAPVNAPINSTVTWTIAITNNGPEAMTQGDTVTLTDTLPGVGATTIASIGVSGGSNTILERGALTCTAGVGDPMPASLDCSRPYQLTGAPSASGVRGLDVGETLTVTYTQPVTEAAGTELVNTATVTDRPLTPGNNSDSATTTVIAPPGAVDDEDLGNTLGTAVSLTVTTNDVGTLLPDSVVLWNPTTLAPITSPYVVPGEGTWTVSGDDITFTPLSTFLGDPTPVTYRVSATNGLTSTATVTITYLPEAADDSDLGNTIGSVVNVAVLGNDTGVFVADSVRVVDPATHLPVGTLVVPGEGTWKANADGTITFTPLSTFLGDPTPVDYLVTDNTGDTVGAELTVTYLPTAVNDRKDGNSLGATVVVDPLTNDIGDFDVTSVRLIDPGTLLAVTSLTVAGQGTWVVDTTTGQVTFTPVTGYVGNPTPQTYGVTDTTGDDVEATITVTYLPAASNDQSLGNKQGTPVSVSILGNDNGTLDVSTARLLDDTGTPMMNVVVPGEGSWHMNATTGVVTFTPEPGFTGDPTPMPYRILDTNGNTATANVTITYLHPTALELALTGMSSQTPLMAALAAIILGLGAMVVSRSRRVVARHRA